jgi:hypothetical protein
MLLLLGQVSGAGTGGTPPKASATNSMPSAKATHPKPEK